MKKLLTVLFLSFAMAASSQAPQKSDSTLFYVIGNLKDFQLLYKALTDHDNVTPNQVKSLVEWISKAQVLPPPEEKDEKKKEPIKK